MALTPDKLERLYALGLSEEQMKVILMMLAEEGIVAGINNKRSRDAQYQRNKRERDRRAQADDLFERPLDNEQRYADASIAAEASQTASQTTSQTDKRNPHKENTSFVRTQEVKIHDDDDAGATSPPICLVSAEAHEIASAIGREAGFEPVDTPPGWCGAVYVIQKFLDRGCPGEIVRLGCTTALRRKRDGPPHGFVYFEKPIAVAFAQFQRPLPEVAVPKMEVIHGGKYDAGARTYDTGRGRSRNLGSATDAAADLCEYFTRIADEEERAAQRVDRKTRGISDGRLPEG